MKGKKQKDLG